MTLLTRGERLPVLGEIMGRRPDGVKRKTDFFLRLRREAKGVSAGAGKHHSCH